MRKACLVFFLSILLLVFAVGCRKIIFNGSISSSEKQIIMSYTTLNRTETKHMKLQKGQVINVVIESESGSVDVLVADSTGQELYRGDDAVSGKFSLKIPKEDTYIFTVTGKNAKGGVSFKLAD